MRLPAAGLGLSLAVLCAVAASSDGQIAENVSLLANLDLYGGYADIWGYSDEFGNEFALVGAQLGTSIVNVSVPGSPVETGFIPGAPSAWREIKTYGDYAYVVTEGSSGYLQIIDLTNPFQPVARPSYQGIETAHQLYIETATARAYICGSNIGEGGVRVLDLSNPLSPVLLGDWDVTYVHDLYVRDHIGYLAQIFEPSFSIVDFTNPASIPTLAGPIVYPGAFTHNTWLNDAGNILFTTDENSGGHVQLWDHSNLASITKLGDFRAGAANSIAHNVHIRGELGYVSYYTEGFRIFEFSDPTAPAEVGYYDTFAPVTTGFQGAWGVYPYLPSGRILVSDMSTGLWVFERSDNYGLVQGGVTEQGVGSAIGGVAISLAGTSKNIPTSAVGTFTLSAAPGAYTLHAELEGFFAQDLPISITQGATTPLNIALVRRPSAPLSGVVRGQSAGSKAIVPLGAAQIELLGTGYRATSAADGSWSIPIVPIDSYTVRVARAGFGRVEFPLQVQAGGTAQGVLLAAASFYDSADTDLGWQVGLPGDTAINGKWIRAVPVPSNGGVVQPGYDATPAPSAGLCYLTGNAPSPDSATGAADVDDGFTRLQSPTLNANGLSDPHIAYSRWYINEAGSYPGMDVFTVEISNDGGASWTLLEQLTKDAKPWTRVFFRISDYLTPTNNMRVRFIADDAPFGSIVEALIDDFEIFDALPLVVDSPVARTASEIASVAPNPFNPNTRIQFYVGTAGPVRLDVVDARGRHVATLVESTLAAGMHDVRWLGKDDAGNKIASGSYVAVLRTQQGNSSRKLSLVK